MRRCFPILTLLFASTLAVGCGGSKGDDDDNVDTDAGISDLPDADGDTIADEHEGRGGDVDTDGDGTPDWEDLDSDDDGIPDYREAGDDLSGTPPVDSDGDGTPDFRDTDSDGNERPDGVDGVDDLDGDGVGNFADLDDDGDGMLDTDEMGPSPMMPLDSDGDGLYDFQDPDSDNDTIKDLHEGMVDIDDDMIPAYLDDDSDGDCRADSVEAGDADLDTPPLDSDGDGKGDFLDLDSDNDGLLDSLEDANCNGTTDPGESSSTSDDTDGDGISDLIEVAAGTDPTDPGDNPAINGDFVFKVPYNAPPDPLDDTLDFSTNVSQADVVFVMDTTGSMGGEINNLKTSLSSTIIPAIRTQVPNSAFGVVDYRDFRQSPYGSSGDFPFLLRHRVMTTNTGAGLTSVQNAVNAYTAGGGNDGPESLWEALYQTATGAGVSAGGSTVAAFNPATAPPATPPAGEFTGDIGGAGFRTGSLPIAVFITDNCGHNSDIGTANNYSFVGTARSTNAINELVAISARVIAVVSGNPCTLDQQALGVVNATGALVPPTAWGPAGMRPSGCSPGQCCTGLNGTGQATDGAGMCPLVFQISSNGSGLGTAAADAVEALTGYGTLDISADPQDDPADAIDAVAEFVDRIEANPSAPAPCAPGLVAIDVNPTDGVNETFDDVTPGTTVCYDVVPKMNTTVPALTTPQMFKATIVVEGDGITTLDTRDIFFLVPPEIPDEPID